jgi:outer membrane protein assembly factor BamB
VPVPNFAALYQKRQAILGRELLLADTRPAGVTLRLYDILTGKDLWSQTFDSGSVVLRSEEPGLAGVVEPGGRVIVVDLRQRKPVLSAVVDLAHVKKVQQAHLLADDQSVFVAFHVNNPNDQGGIWPNVQGNTGLRAVTVSGEVYAFDRRTGRTRWHNTVESEQLVLEEWKEMPLLLFTARHQPMMKAPGGGRFMANYQEVRIEAYNKASGKLEYRNPSPGRPQMTNQQYQQIYAINNDVRDGKIELIAHNYKITITAEDGKKP